MFEFHQERCCIEYECELWVKHLCECDLGKTKEKAREPLAPNL